MTSRRKDALAADREHRPFRLYELCRIELMSLPFVGDAPADRSGQRLIVARAAEKGFDIRFGQGEQAITDFAVRSEPEAVATPAKWPGHRGDDADPAATIDVAEVHRRGPRVVIVRGHQLSDFLLQYIQKLVGEEYLVALPRLRADRH